MKQNVKAAFPPTKKNTLYILNTPSTTCSWISIFINPRTTIQSTNQTNETRLQFMSRLGLQPGLDTSTSVLFTYLSDFRDNLWIMLDLGVGIRVRTKFSGHECCFGINKIC